MKVFFWVLGIVFVLVAIDNRLQLGSERAKRVELEAELRYEKFQVESCDRSKEMLFTHIARLSALVPVDSIAQAKYEEIIDSIWSYPIDSSEVKDD